MSESTERLDIYIYIFLKKTEQEEAGGYVCFFFSCNKGSHNRFYASKSVKKEKKIVK